MTRPRRGEGPGPVQRAESGRTGSMAQSTSLKQKRRLLSSRPTVMLAGLRCLLFTLLACRTGRECGCVGGGGGGEMNVRVRTRSLSFG